MAMSTITKKFCFLYDRYLRKSFKRQLRSQADLILTCQKVIHEICKNLYEPKNEQVHLQSQECIRKETQC